MRTHADAGSLRRRLTIEAPMETADESGGYARSWTSLAQVWASVEAISMRREFVALREANYATHKIQTRWRPDINGAMRFRDGARIFMIITAQDADTRRKYLVCHCRETKS